MEFVDAIPVATVGWQEKSNLNTLVASRAAAVAAAEAAPERPVCG